MTEKVKTTLTRNNEYNYTSQLPMRSATDLTVPGEIGGDLRDEMTAHQIQDSEKNNQTKQ